MTKKIFSPVFHFLGFSSLLAFFSGLDFLSSSFLVSESFLLSDYFGFGVELSFRAYVIVLSALFSLFWATAEAIGVRTLV